ncbi:MAG: response regulator transcription factor [Pirellulaceae bacterium]|jgi:DNA-binding NarL/FixJ family response regulator|nr:response regulator transcription factor [Pirellulaceae bacterium]
MSIRLIVVDDHPVIRRGLENMLEGSGISIVGEAASAEQALSLLSLISAEVVLLDVRMPDGDGLDCLSRIKLDHPDVAVLMYSTFGNPTYVARAVALGAVGYVTKGKPKELLCDAICRVAKGETVWSRDELRRVTGALATPRLDLDVEVPLTAREAEVLKHLTSGKTNKEIANSLTISYETVKEHVQNILRKIGVTDRTQAAVWAFRKGIV